MKSKKNEMRRISTGREDGIAVLKINDTVMKIAKIPVLKKMRKTIATRENKTVKDFLLKGKNA